MQLNPNEFIIIPPQLFHRYQADLNDPWTLYWVHFSSDKLMEFNADYKAEMFYTPTSLRFNQRIIDVWVQMFASLSDDLVYFPGLFINKVRALPRDQKSLIVSVAKMVVKEYRDREVPVEYSPDVVKFLKLKIRSPQFSKPHLGRARIVNRYRLAA